MVVGVCVGDGVCVRGRAVHRRPPRPVGCRPTGVVAV